MIQTETFTPDAPLKFIDELNPLDIKQLQEETAQDAKLPVFFHDTLKTGGHGPELAIIPAGRFDMGSEPKEFGHQKEEFPRHLTMISKPFAIGVYPVMAAEFEVFRQQTEWYLRQELIWHQGRYPVINVRMDDTRLFLDWLSERTGKTYRLPTEAEWEYAARAGTTTPFTYGDNVSCKEVHFNPLFPYKEAQENRRWYMPRCFPSPKASETGIRLPNAWGLHDMHGNVWEFTSTHWTPSHRNANRDGSPPAVSANPYWYVTKGGSWFDPATLARSAARKKRYLDEMDTNLGFRVVREL